MQVPGHIISTVLDAPLPALPDLYEIAATQGDVNYQRALERHAQEVGSTVVALIQKSVVAGGAVGYIGPAKAAVQQIVGLDPLQLAVGMFQAFGVDDLLKELAIELLEVLVEEVLGSMLSLITSIPVIGWIVEIVVGFVKTIVSVVKAAKNQSKEPPEAEYTPELYSASLDASEVRAAWQLMQGLDWGPLFLPEKNIGMGEHAWSKQGFTCSLLTNHNRRIAWAGGQWVSDGKSSFGFGFQPGTDAIMRMWEFPASFVSTGRAYFPQLRSACIEAWALVGSDEPPAFCVATDKVVSAWTDAGEELFGALLNQGQLCPSGLPTSGAHSPYDLIVKDWGGDPKVRSLEVLDTMPTFEAMRVNLDRQKALLQHTLPAYVPDGGPWRDEIRASKRDILTSDVVCLLSLEDIADPLFRGQVELERQRRGAQCYMVGGSIAHDATLKPGLIPLHPGAPKPRPPLPIVGVGTRRPPVTTGSTTGARPTSPGSGPMAGARPTSPSSGSAPSSGGGAGLAILAIAVLVGLFASSSK